MKKQIRPRAALVCVDYADILALTLPRNRHHFSEVLVVTTAKDVDTIDIAVECDSCVYTTNAFYDDGADFNKWKALEQGLDAFGRRDWMCLLDADVIWPEFADLSGCVVGNLYTPKRRMLTDINGTIPSEADWVKHSLHPQQREWAGYTQIFHAADPAVADTPWHDVSWRHAGGADSFFQQRWPNVLKHRPPFEVLHLGESGRNWCGRVQPYRDGSIPSGSADRTSKLRKYIQDRRTGPDRFGHEKLN